MDFSPAITLNAFALVSIFILVLFVIFIWLGFFQSDTNDIADISIIGLIFVTFFLVLFPLSNFENRKMENKRIKCYDFWQEFREDDSLVNYLKWEKECN